MAITSILLPALALAAGAAAQCSSSATMTIQNSGDASALSGCQTYTGSIALATGTTDTINLAGVRKITGDLVANNVTGLPSLGADSLESIGGTMNLKSLTILTSLTFPRLTSVGTIDWETIPRLNALSFTTGVKTASNVGIVDTGLGSLQGIQLETVNTLILISNGQLTSVNMPLETVNRAMTVAFNSQNMNVSFPNLEVAYNATFQNVTGVDMPALTIVNGSLGFQDCFFSSLALPNLTAVGNSVTIVRSPNLANLTAPALNRLGGALQVTGNPGLSKISFDQVNTVLGAVEIAGNYSDFTMANLGSGGNGVQGAFNLTSAQNINATCSRFQAQAGRNLPIKGKFTCVTVASTSNSGSSGTSSGSSGSSSSTPKGAAGAISARAVAGTGLIGLCAAMFGMF